MRAVSCGAWKPIEFSALTKSSRHCALRWSASASASCASVAPAAFAAAIASSMSVSATAARCISACVRSWIVATRAWSSASATVAGLARARDVQQRAAHPVVADLDRAFALVRHVAVGAGDAGARVDALAPGLELRMLRLQHLGARLGVLPVVEAVAVGELRVVVGRLDLLDLQALRPREEQRRLRPAVVLDVALAADERAHLLARRVGVRVVGRAARRRSRQRSMLGRCGTGASLAASAAMPTRKPGRVTRSAIVSGSWQSTQLTGCAPSTCSNALRVAARDRVRRAGLRPPRRARPGTASLPSATKPGMDVAVAEPAVGRDHRGVAVQARARLRALGDALGLLLVVEHVGVAAALAEVERERVAGEHALQPRVRLEPLTSRQRLAAAVAACASCRPCAGSRRTGAGSSCPTAPDRSCPRRPRTSLR